MAVLSSLMSLCRSRDLCFFTERGSPGHPRPRHALTEAPGGSRILWETMGLGRLESALSLVLSLGTGVGEPSCQPHASPSVASWFTWLQGQVCGSPRSARPCLPLGSPPSCQGLLPPSGFLLRPVSLSCQAPGSRQLPAGSLGSGHGDITRPFQTTADGGPSGCFSLHPQPHRQPRCGPGQSWSGKPSLPSTPFSQN